MTVDVLSLSLISHTNVGKTTLARTLLRRDVGEVLDRAHVTSDSERYVMLEVPGEGRIVLWDTPGFGDSARLYRELADRDDPIAWLAEQDYDIDEQRALASSRRAVLNVRDEAGVVLYLVNASEDPAAAGYVEPEMRILGWIDRPVVVVLNQSGAPSDSERRRAEEERWRWHLASHAAVREVLSLDAFSRCWVQEGLLLLRLEALVADDHRGLMTRLLEEWSETNRGGIRSAAQVLASLLWNAARDSEAVEAGGLARLSRRTAAEKLGARLDRQTLDAADALIELHGLIGDAAVGARSAVSDVRVPGDRPDPRRVGAIAGLAGGAVGGLIADIASGGLTFGGGAVAGAILGGLGLGGLAWGFDQLGGDRDPRMSWSIDFLDRQLRDAALRYLAVAHFGRGAGAYQRRVEPAFWSEVVERRLAPQRSQWHRRWEKSRASDAPSEPPAELADSLAALLAQLLIDLYPGCERLIGPEGSA